ncbi:hypothetical protein SELMODRAFT_423030 [Selaginella moellendorffii]|uniref:Uncharacterized protein n=1 Tax=Selaginella moellendorffii TaxID=88036 RepID=D8SKC3_SELML|nr:hypothetical protein SELMODRAFT_423030 [Selaginella moellendorffii]
MRSGWKISKCQAELHDPRRSSLAYHPPRPATRRIASITDQLARLKEDLEYGGCCSTTKRGFPDIYEKCPLSEIVKKILCSEITTLRPLHESCGDKLLIIDDVVRMQKAWSGVGNLFSPHQTSFAENCPPIHQLKPSQIVTVIQPNPMLKQKELTMSHSKVLNPVIVEITVKTLKVLHLRNLHSMVEVSIQVSSLGGTWS